MIAELDKARNWRRHGSRRQVLPRTGGSPCQGRELGLPERQSAGKFAVDGHLIGSVMVTSRAKQHSWLNKDIPKPS